MFTDLQIPAGRRAMTRGEMLTVATLSAVVGVIFLLEVLDDYVPQKLSILFFVLFWVPMLVVHEIGHALAARIVGWRVREIVIGFGHEIARLHFGKTRVLIKLAPMEGYVLPEPQSADRVRLKSAFVYAAGPGAELLLLAMLVLAFGWEGVFNQSSEISSIALKTLATVIIVGAGINLLPFRTDGGVSDGLGILISPFQTSEAIEFRLAAAEVREAARLLNTGRFSDARKLVRQLVGNYPQNFMFRLMLIEVLAACGESDRAQEELRELRRSPHSDSESRMLWHAEALVEMEKSNPSWNVVDSALDSALQIEPRANDLLVTKGASLVLRGSVEEGGDMLANVFRQCEDSEESSRALAYLVIAAYRIGNADAVARFRSAFDYANTSKIMAARVDQLAPYGNVTTPPG